MNTHDYEALLEKRAEAYEAMSKINDVAEFERRDLSASEAEEFDRLEADFDAVNAKIKRAKVERSGHPIPNRSERKMTRIAAASEASTGLGANQEIALRAIEHSDAIDTRAGDHLEGLIRRDKFGFDAAYIAAVAEPAYLRAFFKKLMAVDGAEGILDTDEAEAMRAVAAAMSQRAMAVGAGATGGYAIPLALDPGLILANDGAINPIRELANVTTIAGTTWQGVSTEGVEFVFQGEAEEAEDGSPTLARLEITPTKATCFIPYSIESEQDWDALAGEMRTLLSDAKSVKEAEIFATGKGSEHIPQGLITGATELVETAESKKVGIADIYSVQEKLAPRYQPSATWLGTNKVANQIHKFVAVGDTEEAPLMSPDRSSILGKAYREVSTMSSKTTTENEKVLAYGDIKSAYKIVDRIGMTVEIVPHLFGEGLGENNPFPTGQRGLYAYFRVGAKVITPGAVQVLKVKA